MYYLQSRYYDAGIGRFINSDDVQMLFEDQDTMVQYNLFAYCGNSPLINIDPTGYGKIGVIYYCNNKSSLSTQAHNSGYFALYSKNVESYAVRTVKEFVYFWNQMSNNLDYVFLYLHGDPGVLHFADGTLGFEKGNGCSYKYNFNSLKSKKVKKGISLFSCYGGKGEAGNKKGCNVAWMFSKKANGKPVLACTGGVSYYSLSGKYYARCSRNIRHPKRWGSFYSFYYNKKNKAKKSYYGWFA